MSRTVHPTAVGTFVLAMLLLASMLLFFFSGSPWWSPRDRYVLLYDTTIRGLNVGAPVAIKGVRIGQVTDISAQLYEDTMEVLNTVTIEIDPKVLELSGDRPVSLDELVEHGLRAQLRTQSILTGLLYVNVDFFPDRPVEYHQVNTRYTQLPTMPTELQQLSRDFENLDLMSIVSDVQFTLDGVGKLLNNPELHRLPEQLGKTLEALQTAAEELTNGSQNLIEGYGAVADNTNALLTETGAALPEFIEKLEMALSSLEETSALMANSAANTAFLTSDDSPVLYRVGSAARSIDAAAAQLQRLTELLEREPQSLLFGRQNGE